MGAVLKAACDGVILGFLKDSELRAHARRPWDQLWTEGPVILEHHLEFSTQETKYRNKHILRKGGN